MLPGPAVPGSCLASFHFRWAIHPIRPVLVCRPFQHFLDIAPLTQTSVVYYCKCNEIRSTLVVSITPISHFATRCVTFRRITSPGDEMYAWFPRLVNRKGFSLERERLCLTQVVIRYLSGYNPVQSPGVVRNPK